MSLFGNVPLEAEARDMYMAEDGDPHRVVWQRKRAIKAGKSGYCVLCKK